MIVPVFGKLQRGKHDNDVAVHCSRSNWGGEHVLCWPCPFERWRSLCASLCLGRSAALCQESSVRRLVSPSPSSSSSSPALSPSSPSSPWCRLPVPWSLASVEQTHDLRATTNRGRSVARRSVDKISLWCHSHVGQFPQDGENGQNMALFHFLELRCDQTVRPLQLYSTVLKRLCPLDSKNVFALALAHLEPELEPFSHSRAKKNKKNATFDHFPRPGEIDPYVKRCCQAIAMMPADIKQS